MEDPWGSDFAKTVFGQGLAVMTGLAPLLTIGDSRDRGVCSFVEWGSATACGEINRLVTQY